MLCYVSYGVMFYGLFGQFAGVRIPELRAHTRALPMTKVLLKEDCG